MQQVTSSTSASTPYNRNANNNLKVGPTNFTFCEQARFNWNICNMVNLALNLTSWWVSLYSSQSDELFGIRCRVIKCYQSHCECDSVLHCIIALLHLYSASYGAHQSEDQSGTFHQLQWNDSNCMGKTLRTLQGPKILYKCSVIWSKLQRRLLAIYLFKLQWVRNYINELFLYVRSSWKNRAEDDFASTYKGQFKA